MDSINSHWTVNSTSINSVVQAAGALAAPVEELMRAAGINAEALNDPDARHRVSSLHQLYLSLIDCCGEDIGLYVGRVEYINRLNMQLYTCGICRTFREYLNVMPSVLRFAGDIGEVRVSREAGLIRMDWLPLWSGASAYRYQSDEVLSTAVSIVRSICVPPIPVVKACFTYARPADCTMLRQTFGEVLVFSQPRSCLYFDEACLDYPLIQLHGDWNEGVCRATRHLFDDEPDEVVRELRRSLMRLLPTGEFSIDTVAGQQNISRRTLQRRLTERGTHFAEVLQALRKELAVQYIADKNLTITNVALLLGYADHSSFSSAFKSWHGVSPRDFRRAQGAR